LKEIIKHKIESVLGDKIISQKQISGGCINDAELVTSKSGKTFFVKTNSNSAKDMFVKEANGLNELAKADVIRVPKVVCVTDDFIILENISSKTNDKLFWEKFGRNFAMLHKYTSSSFGFYEDNYIGSTLQVNLPNNTEKINWSEFYFNKRLLYQFRLAEKKGFAGEELRKCFSQLGSKINLIFNDCNVKPSLLHGDLWSGNFITDETGNACLIDPAVYYGHREADLAMTKLFGGFDSRFYSAYNEEYPLDSEYGYRENIYKLYHILNHLNLFGCGYYQQAVNLIKFYL
jgi:fructosamine-3-kinase